MSKMIRFLISTFCYFFVMSLAMKINKHAPMTEAMMVSKYPSILIIFSPPIIILFHHLHHSKYFFIS